MLVIIKEFREFLAEYKVLGLAAAFIIGAAATGLVSSLVNNIIMPVITAFLPSGDWQTAVFSIGAIKIGWGPFMASLVNFMVIALVVFAISKWVIKEERATKK